MTRFVKGDRVQYTGPYAPGITTRYGPGTIVGFRRYGEVVTVELDNGNFADWPVGDVSDTDRVNTYCVTCEAVREAREPGGDIQLIQTDADQVPTDPDLWAELVVNLTDEDVPAFHDATHVLAHEPVESL